MSAAGLLDRFTPMTLGDGLLLRAVHLDDAVALAELVHRDRAHLAPFLGDLVERIPDVAAARAHLAQAQLSRAQDELLELHLFERAQLCGAVRLRSLDWRDGSGNIGYLVGASHAGRGLTTRVVRAVLTWVFAELPLHRIELRCAAGNLASAAVARRLGFTLEGTARAAERDGDGHRDVLVFSRLRTDPAPAR